MAEILACDDDKDIVEVQKLSDTGGTLVFWKAYDGEQANPGA